MSDNEQVTEGSPEVTNDNESVDTNVTEAVTEKADDNLPSLEDYNALVEQNKNQAEALERLAKNRDGEKVRSAKLETILNQYGIEDIDTEIEFVAGEVKLEKGQVTEKNLRYRPEKTTNIPKLQPAGRKLESSPKVPAAEEKPTSSTIFDGGAIGLYRPKQ